jgi:hypothetical protein
MNMETLYQYLIHDLFRRFLSSDNAIAEKVAQFTGSVSLQDKDLLFTLPGLFTFAATNFAADRPDAHKISLDDFLRFRKTLYDNPTNSLLKHYGGMVDIETVSEDQMLTVYRLKRVC